MIDRLAILGWILSILAGIFSIAVSVYGNYFFSKRLRKNRAIKLSSAVKNLSKYRIVKPFMYSSDRHDFLERFSSEIARIFNKVTDDNCVVTLFSIKVEGYETYLVWEADSRQLAKKLTPRPRQKLIQSPIYLSLYSARNFFLDNNLFSVPHLYDEEEIPKRKHVSLLVVPIFSANPRNQDVAVGFLSVESDRKGSFIDKIDIVAAQSFAEIVSPHFTEIHAPSLYEFT